MVTTILGRKLGMTQVWSDDDRLIPVTVVEAGPCVVSQLKTPETDGYSAAQLAFGDLPEKKVNRPTAGHFKKAGVAPVRRLAELPVAGADEAKAGDEVKASIFAEKEWVDVIGTSKGKGYQGVVKRHGFGGGRATHGSMFHRAPGSIGSSAYPSRVFAGMRAGGRMGGEQVTVKNLQIVKVDAEQNLIYVRGAVPGPKSGYLTIRRAKRG